MKNSLKLPTEIHKRNKISMSAEQNGFRINETTIIVSTRETN